MAPGADEMKVTRVALRRFVPRTSLAEVDLPRDARFDEPLQRAIYRRAADPRFLRPHQLEQIVGAQMRFLAEENVENPIAFDGVLAAGREERGGVHVKL